MVNTAINAGEVDHTREDVVGESRRKATGPAGRNRWYVFGRKVREGCRRVTMMAEVGQSQPYESILIRAENSISANLP